jgi:ubiquinone/menaquinone biosynthesis C-methylase UbiE
MTTAETLQREYYARTAVCFDAWHGPDEPHNLALDYISALLPVYGVSSILDVGCGTGRGVKHFLERHPGLRVCGAEPVAAMREQAVLAGVPPSLLCEGQGEALPFRDRSFDAVCEFGVLHHVENPAAVVAEMTRVARTAVFLSDHNRFGQGRALARVTKLALYKAHLWRVARYVRTGGRNYHVSEGDGVAYSYSVFDSFDQLAGWADSVLLIPTSTSHQTSWFHPLLTSSEILVCAVRPSGRATSDEVDSLEGKAL